MNGYTLKSEMMDPYVKTESPNQITSGGLGPCIVVGAISKKTGYMVHFHSISISSFDLKNLEDLLKALNGEIKDKSNLEIYVAGGNLDLEEDSEEYNKLIRNDRRKTLRTISNHGLKKYVKKIMWERDLTLDLEKRKAIFD